MDADEEARIGERDAYGAECDRLYAEHGVTAADKAQEAQFDRAEEICAELLDTRAVSLTGVMVKLRLREWMDYHEGEERILASVAADLERWEQALRHGGRVRAMGTVRLFERSPARNRVWG